MDEMRCGGIVDADTSREELIDRGLTPAAADEVLAYRDQLATPAPPVTPEDETPA